MESDTKIVIILVVFIFYNVFNFFYYRRKKNVSDSVIGPFGAAIPNILAALTGIILVLINGHEK